MSIFQSISSFLFPFSRPGNNELESGGRLASEKEGG